MNGLFRLLRPGDYVVFCAGAAAGLALLAATASADAPRAAVVRQDGRTVAELPLTMKQRIEVPGPLGATVIEVEPGRARVASDPGPRQYCVRRGWLSEASATAICAPNRVTLTIAGRGPAYDSLGY